MIVTRYGHRTNDMFAAGCYGVLHGEKWLCLVLRLEKDKSELKWPRAPFDSRP